MAKKHISIILGTLLLVVGGIVLFGVVKGPSEVTTRVVLTGTEGLSITGHGTADGHEYSVSDTLPTSMTLAAKRMSLLLESSNPTNTPFAEVFVNDKKCVAGGGTRIQIDVSGNTIFSKPRAHLKAFTGQ